MKFNIYSNLEGKHAFLSPSKYHWINYDEDKLRKTYNTHRATVMGTILHDFAQQCVLLNQKLPQSQKTLNLFVNDAIGFKMIPEQVLYYSDNCFGTADAISFRNGMLRIHDLKTGVTKAKFEQLEVYAAIFCLEYKIKPSEIAMDLRIYQNDEIYQHTPEVEDIIYIMDRIVTFDRIISEEIKGER